MTYDEKKEILAKLKQNVDNFSLVTNLIIIDYFFSTRKRSN